MMARDTNNDSLLLHALADGELDAAAALALEHRIAAEPVFAADYAQILALKSAVTRLEKPIVSDAFRAKMSALSMPRATPAPPRPAWSAVWQAMAATFVLTAGLASGLTYTLVAPRDGGLIEDAIVNGHRRSLLAASPIDIASSDRHTVRPWFDAKLGVSPPTPDLTAQGFMLVGGRIDVVGDRPVPSLVYRHKEHLITVVALTVAPGTDATEPPAPGTAGGYNVVRWSGPGFRYWAISDLDAAELNGFVDDLRPK